MKADLCYTTGEPGEVLFLDGQAVTPDELARSRIYQAWRAYDGAPVLPMTPLRWLASVERAAALTLFPRTPPEDMTP